MANWYNGFSPAQRNRSWQWLKKKYEDGSVALPQVCEVCGQKYGKIQHHVEDYSAPFGEHNYEFELCYTCHMMIHCRFKNRDRWDQYRALMSLGYQFEPVPCSQSGLPSWQAFKARYLERPLLQLNHAKLPDRGRTALDRIAEAEENGRQAEI